MAKQWTKKEKIIILNDSIGLSDNQAAKKHNLSKSTITRWRCEDRKLGEKV